MALIDHTPVDCGGGDHPVSTTQTGSGSPAQGNLQAASLEMSRDYLTAPIFVRPTGKPLNEKIGAWVESEWSRSIPQWRTVFRGDVRTVSDTAVTDEIQRDSNLILWGDPSSNAYLAKILERLPLTWTAEKVTIGHASYPGATHVPVLIFPNPLNPKRYIVLNSSFTFRQGANTTNALQTPNLPDWAIIDLNTPPSAKWPGLVVDAGFFDENWQPQK